MKTETYILPSYWASALINNDLSGCTDEDCLNIAKFVTANAQPNCMFSCIDCSEESYFTHGHDANRNEGSDVLEYTFDVTPL